MRLISAFLFCACGLLLAGAAENDPAVRVIVVANANDPDSLRIARHYAAARNVPVENIIALPMPLTETISWREFVLGVWQPLPGGVIGGFAVHPGSLYP